MQGAHLVARQPELRAGRGRELGDGVRVAERVRRLQVDEVRDRQRARRRTLPSRGTIASAGSASITAAQEPTSSMPSKIFSMSAQSAETSIGSNCLPARAPRRLLGRRRHHRQRCATSTNSASCTTRAASGIASPATPSGPARARPTARTSPQRVERPSRAEPSSSPSARASRGVRGDHAVQIVATRERELEAGADAVQRRVPGADPAQHPDRVAEAERVVVVLRGLSTRCRHRTTSPARARRSGSRR